MLATPPTIDLVAILLQDALRLMNGPDRESELPLYSERQVEHLLARLVPVKFHQPMRVRDVEVRWLPASHILGAAMIQLTTPAGTVLFTGDYSVTAQHTVPALSRPDLQADLVISEATYGERLHEDRAAAEERLLTQIREVVDRGGRVLIPAFAVGRAQEVLLDSQTGSAQRRPARGSGVRRWDGACGLRSLRETRAVRVPISGSRNPPRAPSVLHGHDPAGHAARGPPASARRQPLHHRHFQRHAGRRPFAGVRPIPGQNADDAIFLTGYQDEESPGRALLDLGSSRGSQGAEARPGDGARRLLVRHVRAVRRTPTACRWSP